MVAPTSLTAGTIVRMLKRSWSSGVRSRHMLVDEDRVSVEIEHREACGPRRGVIRLSRQRGQDVPVEHPLEQSDRGRLVLEDEPVLSLVSMNHVTPSFS